jgi:uncharacterized protein YbjT (DUF2867 family)
MVLVTGATGNVGREVVQQLHAAGQRVRVFSRNPEKVEWPATVETIKGDLADLEAVKTALNGMNKVFLIRVPGCDHLLKIAKQMGVEHIVFLSASAIDAKTENAIGRAHLHIEEQIRQSGVNWTFLRPGAFMSNVLQYANLIRSERIVRAPFGDVKGNPIDPRDIAAVAVQALLSSDHNGKTYTLTGPEILTAKEQVQVLADLLGENIRFEDIPPEIAKETMKRFAPSEIVDALFQLMLENSSLSTTVSHTVEDVTGNPAHTFKQWANDNINSFR